MGMSQNQGPEVGATNQPSIAATVDWVWAQANQGRPPQSVGRAEFPVFADDALAPPHKKLNEYLDPIAASRTWRIKARKIPAGVSILALPVEEMLAAFRGIV